MERPLRHGPGIVALGKGALLDRLDPPSQDKEKGESSGLLGYWPWCGWLDLWVSEQGNFSGLYTCLEKDAGTYVFHS